MKQYIGRVMFLVVGLVAGVLISRVGVNPVYASPHPQGTIETCEGVLAAFQELVAQNVAQNDKLDILIDKVMQLPMTNQVPSIEDFEDLTNRVKEIPTRDEAPTKEDFEDLTNRVKEIPTRDEAPSIEDFEDLTNRVKEIPTKDEAPSKEEVKVVNDTTRETNELVKTLPQILKRPN